MPQTAEVENDGWQAGLPGPPTLRRAPLRYYRDQTISTIDLTYWLIPIVPVEYRLSKLPDKWNQATSRNLRSLTSRWGGGHANLLSLPAEPTPVLWQERFQAVRPANHGAAISVQWVMISTLRGSVQAAALRLVARTCRVKVS